MEYSKCRMTWRTVVSRMMIMYKSKYTKNNDSQFNDNPNNVRHKASLLQSA